MTDPLSPIQFGTSGHRGLIGSGFTADHVRAISQAVATYLIQNHLPLKIILGYDPRQGNDPLRTPGSFTQIAVTTLLNTGISVLFCTDYCPTPVISWAITHYQLGGGLILTASHNPPSYNGLKFNPPNGAPAPTEITTQLQTLANTYLHNPTQQAQNPGQLTPFNPIDEFAKSLVALVQTYVPLPQSKLLIDAKHGATAATWEAIAHHSGIQLKFIHQAPSPTFEGIDPNPTLIPGLSKLQALLTKEFSPMACANDPDGDRHILLDENGTPLTPEETTLIIAQYFLDQNLPLKGIVTTVASSGLIKSFCTQNNLFFAETAVGFKYFAPYFEDAQSEKKLLLGVESSGGFSISSHTQEKCGFIPALLVLAIQAKTGLPVSKLTQNIHNHYGHFYFLEDAVTLTNTQKESLKALITSNPISTLTPHFSFPIQEFSTQDGLKLRFRNEKTWSLWRLSGTEPVARIYVESTNPVTSQTLLENARQFLLTSAHLPSVFLVLMLAHFLTSFFN